MNAVRSFIGLLAVAALFIFAGCSGPAPGLDPIVTFDFPSTTELPYFSADGVLVIEGDISVNNEDSNPVTSIQWAQSPAIGVFTSTTTMGTSWRVQPDLVATITSPTDVTLTVTVKTLQGGLRVVPLDLVILPAVAP